MANFPIRWPNILQSDTSSTASSGLALTAITISAIAGTHELVVIGRAEEDCTITQVGWVQGLLTGSPGTLRTSIQTVGTDGQETGTIMSSGNAYLDKTSWSSSDNGKYIISTLGSSVSLTRGQLFALVAKSISGTWNSTNSVTIGYYISESSGLTTPYILAGGNRPSAARLPNMFMRSSTRSYLFPYESIAEWDIQSTSSPDEIGVVFVVPSGLCDTYNVRGIGLAFDAIGGSTFTISLYEGTSRTALQNVDIDSDQLSIGALGTGNANGVSEIYFDESTLSTLTAGTTYRITIKATSTVSAGRLRSAVLPTANDMTAWIGTEATYYQTEWGGSSYTDRDTYLPPIQLLINNITEPTGGGGLLVHPGMTGGIRG